MARMTINLMNAERDALVKLAMRERRDARRQAEVIIRAELKRRGLLPADANAHGERKAEPMGELKHEYVHA